MKDQIITKQDELIILMKDLIENLDHELEYNHNQLRGYRILRSDIALLESELSALREEGGEEKSNRVSGDYDIWYKPCEKCGYDTGKSTIPKEGNKTCWKCGNFVGRDYSDRALKKPKEHEQEIIKEEDKTCKNCKYHHSIKYHDKMWCRDCCQKDKWTPKDQSEQEHPEFTVGVLIVEKIYQETEKLANGLVN